MSNFKREEIMNLFLGLEKSDYLSKKGYVINKKEYSKKFIDNICCEMWVTPTNISGSSFPIFKQEQNNNNNNNKDLLILPKFFGYKKLGIPSQIKMPISHRINLNFNGKLYPHQIEPYNKFMLTTKTNEYPPGGIISLPCGSGKTVLSLKIIADLGVKTMIIVHRTFLMNQWIDRINQYLPGSKIGTINGDNIDTKNKDIVIIMLQSLCKKSYENNIFDDIGFTIVDECHHISAEIFSKALPKINSYYTLGLSATPERIDGLSKVFEWYLGPFLYISYENHNISNVDVKIVNFIDKSKNNTYSKIEKKENGDLNSVKMMTNIIEYNERNEFIIDILINKIPKDKKILALSDRREHLINLRNKINESNEICGLYLGGMKQEELKESEKKRIILSTYSMASESLDIPSLNTLLLMTPHNSGPIHTQSCGRILHSDDTHPIIWDIVDNFSFYKIQAKNRLEYYRRQKYNITII